MHTLIVIAVAALMACAQKTSATKPEVATGAEVSAHTSSTSPRVPMTVEWVLQGQQGNRLTLIARVNRNGPLNAPTAVTVSVPAGVTPIFGPTSWVVPGSEVIGSVDETLVFDVGQGSNGDIVLEADASGPNFGIHAKKVYALSPPPAQQKASAPEPSGPALNIGGRNFGPSVPAKP